MRKGCSSGERGRPRAIFEKSDEERVVVIERSVVVVSRWQASCPSGAGSLLCVWFITLVALSMTWRRPLGNMRGCKHAIISYPLQSAGGFPAENNAKAFAVSYQAPVWAVLARRKPISSRRGELIRPLMA